MTLGGSPVFELGECFSTAIPSFFCPRAFLPTFPTLSSSVVFSSLDTAALFVLHAGFLRRFPPISLPPSRDTSCKTILCEAERPLTKQITRPSRTRPLAFVGFRIARTTGAQHVNCTMCPPLKLLRAILHAMLQEWKQQLHRVAASRNIACNGQRLHNAIKCAQSISHPDTSAGFLSFFGLFCKQKKKNSSSSSFSFRHFGLHWFGNRAFNIACLSCAMLHRVSTPLIINCTQYCAQCCIVCPQLYPMCTHRRLRMLSVLYRLGQEKKKKGTLIRLLIICTSVLCEALNNPVRLIVVTKIYSEGEPHSFYLVTPDRTTPSMEMRCSLSFRLINIEFATQAKG